MQSERRSVTGERRSRTFGSEFGPPSAVRRAGATQEASDRSLVEAARRTGTRAARAAAVEGLLPLARSLARRYHRGEEPLEDLEQVACIGLLKAIDGFDLSRGTTFGAYAVPTIVGELRRHYRDKGWTVRVPRELQELSLKLTKTNDSLEAQLGRPPTLPELARSLETTVERVLEARELGTAMRPVSLDRPVRPEPGVEGEALVEHLGTPDTGYSQAEDAFTTRMMLTRLPERERQIIQLRFTEELTQTEIGERLGISQMHVSRLLRRSLNQLSESAPGHPASRPLARPQRNARTSSLEKLSRRDQPA
jgi:RNA polymerase sigma-B factor